MFAILSPDNKKVMCTAWGAYVWVIDTEKDGTQTIDKFDIIKNSGWTNFALSLDCNTLIQTNQYDGSFWVVNLRD